MNMSSGEKDWPLGTVMWYAVLIWFSSSLLSQSLYLAFYRQPYDAIVLLQTLGPLYYVVVVIEAIMWIALLVLAISKLKSTKSQEVADPIIATSA
jgi:hypothetical protein